MNRWTMKGFWTCWMWVFVFLAISTAQGKETGLEEGFLSPPSSSRPHTWWHWMNGMVTQEGITADLEAMARVGVGGAQIFNVGDKGSVNIPDGPAPFMSPQWLDLVHHAAKEADRLGVEICLHNCAGWSSSGGPWIDPEHAMQILTLSEKVVEGPKSCEIVLDQPPTRLNCYREIVVLAFPTPEDAAYRIKDYRIKAGFDSRYGVQPDLKPVPDKAIIQRKKLVDLSAKVTAGKLTWDVPAGSWTILRIGYTPTGKDNHPAPEAGRGLECDKLSREAMDLHWDKGVAPILDKLGPLAGKSLNNSLIDSYEVGCNNWTPKFREEFQKRRGYDLLTYLPALSGRVIDSGEITERFLWDFRRTIADLFADNYFGTFAEKCHAHHLLSSVEPYDGPFECQAVGAKMDVIMGEFWVGSQGHHSCRVAASTAHTHGRTFVGAEAFTAAPGVGRWQNHPGSLKALGDLVWCQGVNRFIFHRYAQQPWLDKLPGMTMGQWGTHFDRTNTWWEPGKAWMTYLGRSQFLLQQGQFVGDVLFFVGEAAPNGGMERPQLKALGYDYDALGTDLIPDLGVSEGFVTLSSGMKYRLLVLPNTPFQTPALARKIQELVSAGASVLGPKPDRSPSLSDYPSCDKGVRDVAKDLWGDEPIGKKASGKGWVYWGQSPESVLKDMAIDPDFQVLTPEVSMPFIHRRSGETEVYFVSNQGQESLDADCAFRVKGLVPELWHPVTGMMEDAPLWRFEENRTVVSLSLDPTDSVFVIFRRPMKASEDPFVGLRAENLAPFPTPPRIPDKIEIVKAVYGVLTRSLPNTVDATEALTSRVKDGRLDVNASNALAGDPANNIVKSLLVVYEVGGVRKSLTVAENEKISLPPAGEEGTLKILGAVYGDLPTGLNRIPDPVAVDVTARVTQEVKDGTLKVRASNDLAGGDPANMILKQLRIDYVFNGQPRSITVSEGQEVEIPSVSWKPVRFESCVRIDKGDPKILAWQAGRYVLKRASQKEQSVDVPSLPDPVILQGPWEVSFPADLGAPAKATFPALMSFPEHSDPGIKYFSGTATYRSSFTLPENWKAQDREVWLDLGRVEVMAEVLVNGTNLGVLWKNPFRADISDATKTGQNELEVRVTNLWPNRIIGDEQFPEDVVWDGQALKEWPKWVKDGTPRPVKERVTFTTWKHWNKTDELQPSGLIGPVQILSAREVPVP